MHLLDIKPGLYVAAISGGVDSVVLLDILSNQKELEIVVAHFDHGIRDNSDEDVEFVKSLAQKYSMQFVCDRVKLGKEASEETARYARYAYLQKTKKEYAAQSIITAHHADDVLETVIINVIRGTGWRGLSALRSEAECLRPLIHVHKKDMYDYAKTHKLSWQEDETNQDIRYLRNYVRLNMVTRLSSKSKQELLSLHDQQVIVREHINRELKQNLANARTKRLFEYSRYFFVNVDSIVAQELLKYITNATRPQLSRALIAIKTAKPNARHQIGSGIELHFTKTTFIVEQHNIVVS